MLDLAAFRAEADSVLATLAAWAPTRLDLESIIVVGSYARGAERVDSDIDVVLLVADVALLLADDSWLDTLVPGAVEICQQSWGPVTERRMLLRSGLIVEFDIATALWAAVPLDAGTARVLGDGAKILYDRDNVAATADKAIGSRCPIELGRRPGAGPTADANAS